MQEKTFSFIMCAKGDNKTKRNHWRNRPPNIPRCASADKEDKMAEKQNNPIEDEEMTVELELEDGQLVNCAVITILSVAERDYIVLLPLDEKGENQDGEVWFYRYHENSEDPNEEPELIYIEEDEEYEKVADAFDEYLDTCEFDEIVDEKHNP